MYMYLFRTLRTKVLEDDTFTKQIKRKISQKSKIAWIVSHCHTSSDREDYVEELQKFLPVDVYGRCSAKKCPKNDCYKFIGDNYMFFLSFENSLCKDYITEKFFLAMKQNVLPIVLGMKTMFYLIIL